MMPFTMLGLLVVLLGTVFGWFVGGMALLRTVFMAPKDADDSLVLLGFVAGLFAGVGTLVLLQLVLA